MNSVGYSKYDPENHFLFDEINRSSGYMCGQVGPSKPLGFDMNRETAESIFKKMSLSTCHLTFKNTSPWSVSRVFLVCCHASRGRSVNARL